MFITHNNHNMFEKTEVLVVDDHPLIGIAMDLLLTDNISDISVEKMEGGKPA